MAAIREKHCSCLFEGVELLQSFVESRVFLVDYVRLSDLEELIGGDAVEPLLLSNLFVAGEVEADEELYRAGIGGLVFGVVGLF